jgi:lipoyl(octanoyl) transferase
MADFAVEWLGTVPYADGLKLQTEAVEARRSGVTGDRLLLLEHPPVVTRGSSAQDAHLLLDSGGLAERGIELHEARRGGDVTYHAPGQLVGYLIVDLSACRSRDVHRFLRAMEAALIETLEGFDLPAKRIDGMTGVFVDRGDPPDGEAGSPERKIASIGIGVRHWITYHGFALNVSLDLDGFDVIVPCGLTGVQMTSLQNELSRRPVEGAGLDDEVRARVGSVFESHFASYPNIVC